VQNVGLRSQLGGGVEKDRLNARWVHSKGLMRQPGRSCSRLGRYVSSDFCILFTPPRPLTEEGGIGLDGGHSVGSALLPHSARDPGSIPGLGGHGLCGVWTFSPCVGFLRVAPVSSRKSPPPPQSESCALDSV